MRVYNLNSAMWTKENLKKRRLKISSFADLNDPFELLSVELPKKVDRKRFQDWKNKVNREYGVLCFSRNWNNPVLWSHYGDKHKGICLGFDVPDSLLKEVKYDRKRLPADIETEIENGKLNEKIREKLLCTKFKYWEYENEERVIVTLDKAYKDENKNLYFLNFDDNLKLKEVIVGARCNIKKSELEKSTEINSKDVNLIKLRLAFRSFRVIENEKGFRHPAVR